jgi:hypothetical protein
MGGQMNEAEQNHAAMNSPHASDTQKQTSNRGAAKLRDAACKELATNGVKIARALRKSSTAGHIQSAKFLYELARLNEELGRTEQARKIRSLAAEWMEEPEWNPEMSEESAETASGGLEPEG